MAGPPAWAMPVASKKWPMAFMTPGPMITLETRNRCAHMNRTRQAPESIWSQSR